MANWDFLQSYISEIRNCVSDFALRPTFLSLLLQAFLEFKHATQEGQEQETVLKNKEEELRYKFHL